MDVGIELKNGLFGGAPVVESSAPHWHLPVTLRFWVRRPAVAYCALMLLLPMLAVPLMIALGRSDFFLHHGASVWVQANDTIFTQRHQHCDVLIYGDSTAMTGIDPDLVDHATGFKTCNISVTNAVLAVTGNLTLDHFLAQNEKPRMLIVQLSPDDFQQENLVWSHTIYAEGMLEQLRHGSPAESRRLLLHHPQEAVAFSGYVAGYTAYYGLKYLWFHVTRLRAEEDRVTVRHGFFTPPAPARKYCDVAEKMRRPGAAFARELADRYRQQYTARSRVVLVDVAPIPSCDENLEAYTRELQGITSNQLQALPIQLFNDGRHYTANGSRVVSRLIAQQVNQAALGTPALDVRPTRVDSVADLTTLSAREMAGISR